MPYLKTDFTCFSEFYSIIQYVYHYLLNTYRIARQDTRHIIADIEMELYHLALNTVTDKSHYIIYYRAS